MNAMMLVVSVCTGLLVYWISRTWLLMKGSESEIEEQLDTDIWWCQRFLDLLHSLFTPSFSA
jgi:hypothetical protein